jgi:histidine triad (HIT) family protein
MKDCLFCKIVAGEIPSDRVGESDHCIAFRDIAPQAPVHVLVVPKKHYQSMSDMPDGSVLGAMAMLGKSVAKELGLVEKGYRAVINTGEDGGQTVHHIHMHILGGRPMKWPPG